MNISLRAKRSREGLYVLPVEIGGKVFDMKLDLGAGSTVISIDFFADGATDEQRQKAIQFIKGSNAKTGRFIGATGDEFQGYLVHAKDVSIGETKFPDFYYYVVLENKRIIALLGSDFLEHCEYQHKLKGEFEITEFDFDGYIADREDAINYEDIVEFIDEMISSEEHVRHHIR